MTVPKTPKSSKKTSHVPKTPKHTKQITKQINQEGKLRMKRMQVTSAIKKKKPKVHSDNVAEKPHKKQTTQADAITANAPKERTEKVQRPKAPLPPTAIDDIDIKKLMAQHTRAREVGKISLKTMAKMSKNGLVDISDISTRPSDILCAAEHTADIVTRIAEMTPIENMRFSKKAIHFTQMLAEQIYGKKLRDVFNMNLISQKQTVTLETVWAERNYQANCNTVAATQVAHTRPSLVLGMIEDTLMSTDPTNLTNSDWDELCVTNTRINTCKDAASVKDAVTAIYGKVGPWKE